MLDTAKEIDREFFATLLSNFLDFLPTLLLAIIILVAGTLLNKLVLKILRRGMDKSRLDKTLNTFLLNILRIVFIAIVLVIALTVLGIPMTSIIAVIGSAGLAVGLAMKDSLANVAAGILVLYGKIFKVGDYVEIGSQGGTAMEIGIAYTKLKTIDGRSVYLPNTLVSSSVIVNSSAEGTRRADFTLHFSYKEDTARVIDIIRNVIISDERFDNDTVFVRLTALGSKNQEITARAFAPTDVYWDAYYDTLEGIKKALDAFGIELFAETERVEVKPQKESK
jgi:small conductance mechanosensitive channel